MKRRIVGFLVLMVGLSLCSSCVIALLDFPRWLEMRPFEEFERLLPFPSGGTLHLENMDGHIEILGWPREECEIYAERRSSSLPDRNFFLWQSERIFPDIEIDRFEDFLKVRTVPDPEQKWGSTVDYFVRVPEAVNLKDIVNERGDITLADLYGDVVVDNREGDVWIENFSGSLWISASTGNVEAALIDIRSEDEIVITTGDGHITLYLPVDVQAKLEAFAPNGEVLSEFLINEQPDMDRLSVTLGEGGASISLTSSNGDIQIRKAEQSPIR